jgi:hypothetical protein
LFPLELALDNGIDLGLGWIIRGEKSWGFSLDLEKLDNTLSFFCVNALQLQSAYKKKMQMGGR